MKIDGKEYQVSDDLKDLVFLKTGEEVIASGQEGRIDSVSISK
ncbi:hypothetical protein [Paenibacillus sp. Soil522]|nr:hypothetical protein [Paenibacillus sp. Soil522]